MSRKKLIAGNWKMNGSLAETAAFAESLAEILLEDKRPAVDVLVCPPSPQIARMASAMAGHDVAVGAQNIAAAVEPGAFTGEVNGAMLTDAGATHVIVGHSERRALFGETDAVVAAKADAAAHAGLTPIVCVGETLQQRDNDETEALLDAQIEALFVRCRPQTLAALVLAYEPIWAIGTGRSATAEQAQAAHAFIRARVATRDAGLASSLRLLYGGSVKPDNAASLFDGADVDGALVGGASLAARSLADITRAAGP